MCYPDGFIAGGGDARSQVQNTSKLVLMACLYIHAIGSCGKAALSHCK